MLDESKQHTRRIFIGQRSGALDQEHQQNKPNKGHSEKTEFNERGLRREGAVLKNEHIWKNIPTLYNS